MSKRRRAARAQRWVQIEQLMAPNCRRRTMGSTTAAARHALIRAKTMPYLMTMSWIGQRECLESEHALVGPVVV